MVNYHWVLSSGTCSDTSDLNWEFIYLYPVVKFLLFLVRDQDFSFLQKWEWKNLGEDLKTIYNNACKIVYIKIFQQKSFMWKKLVEQPFIISKVILLQIPRPFPWQYRANVTFSFCNPLLVGAFWRVSGKPSEFHTSNLSVEGFLQLVSYSAFQKCLELGIGKSSHLTNFCHYFPRRAEWLYPWEPREVIGSFIHKELGNILRNFRTIMLCRELEGGW